MNTALQIKVVGLLGYVAVSTALVLMLPDDDVQCRANPVCAGQSALIRQP
jgi:hypothetical protein